MGKKPRRNLTRWPRLRGHGRGGTRQGARNSSLQVPAHRSLPPSSASRFIEARRRAARSAALRTSLRRHRRIQSGRIPISLCRSCARFVHSSCTLPTHFVKIKYERIFAEYTPLRAPQRKANPKARSGQGTVVRSAGLSCARASDCTASRSARSASARAP